jgi:hypothetical protein
MGKGGGSQRIKRDHFSPHPFIKFLGKNFGKGRKGRGNFVEVLKRLNLRL